VAELLNKEPYADYLKKVVSVHAADRKVAGMGIDKGRPDKEGPSSRPK